MVIVWFCSLLVEIASIEKYVRSQFEPIFHSSVGEEFIDARISPIKEHLKQLKVDCEVQVARGVRPYPTINEVIERPT